MVKKLKAIIFDVDGTLADTEEVHRLAFNHTFGEYGLDWNWTPQLYEELLAISGGRERITRYGKNLRTRFARDGEFEEFVVSLHKAKTRKYAAMLTEGEVTLRPGVHRLIGAAREAGLALGIATSSARSNVETLLDNNLAPGWRDWFSAIETCDSVVEKKPSPAVYQAVIQRLGIDAVDIVAFEDTQNGLKAAVAAGLATVVTTHRFTRNHDFYGAELVVDSVGEPDQPFTVFAGNAFGHRFVDIGLLERLLPNDADAELLYSVARATA
jgi:HAD superfamily hydrolase (TIGR01509 family)